MGALVAVDALHKIVVAIGGGVSVAKAHPWKACSRAMNVISFNRVIPTPLIERSGINPSGFTSGEKYIIHVFLVFY
jgi:hypothetical protein